MQSPCPAWQPCHPHLLRSASSDPATAPAALTTISSLLFPRSQSPGDVACRHAITLRDLAAMPITFAQEHLFRPHNSSNDMILQSPYAALVCIHTTGTDPGAVACRHAITLPNLAAMPTKSAQEHLFSPRNSSSDTDHSPETKRGDIMDQLLWSAEGSPRCNAACETSMQSMVSLHVRSRGLRNLHAASLLIRSISELYDASLAGHGQTIHAHSARHRRLADGPSGKSDARS